MTHYTQIPVSGMCDVCKINPATHWFGDTSCAVCNNPACYDYMYKDYQEHCAAMEEQQRLDDDY